MTFYYSVVRHVGDTPINRSAPSFKAMCEAELGTHRILENKMTAGLVIPARFKPGCDSRCDEQVETLSYVPIDVDQKTEREYPLTPFLAETMLEHCGFEGYIYTSHSNTPEKPRFRVLVPTSRPMTTEEYRTVVYYTSTQLFGELALEDGTLDRKALTPSQPYFRPSCPKENADAAVTQYTHGKPVDVDWVMNNYSLPEHETIQVRSNETDEVIEHRAGLIKLNYERHTRIAIVIRRAYLDGLTVEQAAAAALAFDLKYHKAGTIAGSGDALRVMEGPHFGDRSRYKHKALRFLEDGTAVCPAALDRARSEYRLLRLKYGARDVDGPGVTPKSNIRVPVKGIIPHGLEVILKLKSTSKVETASGECTLATFELPGTKRLVFHKLPENRVARDLVRVWRRLVGREVPEDRLMELEDLIGLAVGARIKQRPAAEGRKAENEVLRFLPLKKDLEPTPQRKRAQELCPF